MVVVIIPCGYIRMIIRNGERSGHLDHDACHPPPKVEDYVAAKELVTYCKIAGPKPW